MSKSNTLVVFDLRADVNDIFKVIVHFKFEQLKLRAKIRPKF